MNNKFKKRLRELREERELTQQALAEVLKTTKYTISAWELGKQEPNITVLVTLAEFFGVTAGYLLGMEN